MKNHKLLLIKVFLTIIICSCGSKSEYPATSLSIDLNNHDDTQWSDVFDKVEVIPLELTSESMISLIDGFLVHGGQYFLMDRSTYTIYKFDSKGNYISKLDKMGSGPSEYHPIADININPYSGNLEFISQDGIFYTYTENFEFIDSFVFPDLLNASKFKIFSEDIILVYSAHHPNNDNNIMLYSRSINDYIKTMRIERPLFESKGVNILSSPIITTSDGFLYCQQFTNSVYNITTEGLELKFTWDFGDYHFEPGDLREDDPFEKFMDQMMYNIEHGFSSLYNYSENKDIIFAQFHLNNKLGTLVYHKNSKEYQIYYDSNTGVSSKGLILLDDGFVAYSRAIDVADVLKNSNNSDNYEYLINNPNESNPVIFKYKFK